jgi:hypothetical protein
MSSGSDGDPGEVHVGAEMSVIRDPRIPLNTIQPIILGGLGLGQHVNVLIISFGAKDSNT